VRLSDQQFEQLVTEGLRMIPSAIRRHMDNIQIIIEEAPPATLLADMGIPEGDTLYGLYEGVPLDERTTEYSAFPDRVTIYRQPLLEGFHNVDEVRREVARTVIHEVAHHFGIEEERLRELGWD
jgi:predicted Zn-dependent protease with MMP-like domain